MSTDNDLNQILIDTLHSSGFADLLAMQIAQSYGERLRDDFGNEVTEKLAKHVEKTIADYIEDYAVQQDIERRVKRAFEGIDKAELLRIIQGETKSTPTTPAEKEKR